MKTVQLFNVNFRLVATVRTRAYAEIIVHDGNYYRLVNGVFVESIVAEAVEVIE